MAKKKAKFDSGADSIVDLKPTLHQHAEFFDKLIELIPARFYLSDDTEKKWFPGLRKANKAAAKREASENIKKARRERLDPEKSAFTTLDLLKQKLEKEKSSNKGEDDDEAVIKPMMADLREDDRSVTYEELRQRLHSRIEELRAGRGGSDNPKRDDKKNKKKQIQQKKRKRDTSSEEKSAGEKSTGKEKSIKDVEEAAKELEFSQVKIDEEEHGKKKKRKLSKAKELEKAMKLEAAKKDPEKGEIIAKKHSWQAATSRAAGIKIHDDPKLLKQSIHKEKKKREKNMQKWKERVETQRNMKTEKQQKRSENIAGRIHEKKMRKIAKREKKLLRPGFEGRKEGFINEGET